MPGPLRRPLTADVAVVGGGIVGLATARALRQARPGWRVLVLEKEPAVAAHQSGRNSGVIHAGVYYPAGSAKAELCGRGRALLLDYCRQEGIPHRITGKVIVATRPDELSRLHDLRHRALANGIAVTVLDPTGLAALEPHAAGLAALHVPSTGIVDFGAVCAAIAAGLEADPDAELWLGAGVAEVEDGTERVTIGVDRGGRAVPVEVAAMVNCAGLHSDEVAARAGLPAGVRIVPFRGEYHELRPERRHLVRGLIYPVPDPRFPFLGVHLTRDIHGGVHAGPNAVPAFGREAYRWRDVRPADVAGAARFGGARRLARRHWRTGLDEVARSASRSRFAAALARLVPEIRVDDLTPAGAGIRAQAVRDDGTLVDDFAFATGHRTVHVLNAPSPAATASLAIAETVARRVIALLDG